MAIINPPLQEDNAIEVPIASETNLGCIKVGVGLSILDGVLSSDASNCLNDEVRVGRYYNKWLYRKRILAVVGNSGSWADTAIDSDHNVVSWEGDISNSNNWQFKLNFYGGSGNYGNLVWVPSSHVFKLLIVGSGMASFATITYLYTKTSDPELT